MVLYQNTVLRQHVQQCLVVQGLSTSGLMDINTRNPRHFQLENMFLIWWTGLRIKLMIRHCFHAHLIFHFQRILPHTAVKSLQGCTECLCMCTFITLRILWWLMLKHMWIHATSISTILWRSLIWCLPKNWNHCSRWPQRYAPRHMILVIWLVFSCFKTNLHPKQNITNF